MPDKEASPPRVPFADRAGRLLLAVLLLVVTAPLWLLWAAVVVVLVVARPFIFYPLVLATIGGLAASAVFACCSAWADAGQAALIALTAGGLLAAYAAFADRFDPALPRQAIPPPWWWYV